MKNFIKKQLCLLCCLFALATSQLSAEIPHAISYQGVLSSAQGTLVPDGEYQLTLSIYDDADATTPVFSEAQRAVVIKGIFNVLIGSTREFPQSMCFDRAYFLGVSVNGGEELRPRSPLTATPYAFRAQTAASADVAHALSPDAKGVVTSVNKVQGDVQFVAGSGIELLEDGNRIIISDAQNTSHSTSNSKSNTAQTIPNNVSFTGDVMGNVNTNSSPWYLTIPPQKITTDKIATGAITADKLAAGAFGSSALANGSVTTAKLADGSVTTPKLADGSVTTPKLADGAVTNVKVTNGTLSLGKLNSSGASSGDVPTYNGSAVVWSAPAINGAAGGDLSGTYPNPTINTSAVTSSHILDGTIANIDVSNSAAIAYSKLSLTNSISNSDIVANAITTSKVANGTVTTSKLADSAVSGLKLLTNAVTTAHIADGSVTLAKVSTSGASSGDVLSYNGSAATWAAPTGNTGAAGGDLAGTYPNPSIGTGAVTSTHILDGTIVNADVSPTAAIAYSKLSLTNSIQNGDIVANAITTSKVANGTVTTSKLADSAVSGLKLLTFAVNTNHLASGSVTPSKISSSGASTGNVLSFDGTNVNWSAPSSTGGPAGGDLSGTYPNPTIGTGVVTSTHISDGTIVSADISATAAIPYSKLTLTNSIQNGDIVANCVTTSKVANGTVTTSKMADSAISGLKLLTFAVTNRHLASGAVTNDKISGTGANTGEVLMYNGSSVNWTKPYTTGRVTAAASTTQSITETAVTLSNTIIVTLEGPTNATYSISARTAGSGFVITTSPALTTGDTINYIVMP